MAKVENFTDVAPGDLDGTEYLYVRRPAASPKDTRLSFASFIRALWAATTNAEARSAIGIITATATLDFASIATTAQEDLTISVPGAAVGDAVALGLPAAPMAGLVFNAFVSATNVVTVRATNPTGSGVDAASALYRVVVFKSA